MNKGKAKKPKNTTKANSTNKTPQGKRFDCQFSDLVFKERKGRGDTMATDKNRMEAVKIQKICSLEKSIPKRLSSNTIGNEATKIPDRVLGKPLKVVLCSEILNLASLHVADKTSKSGSAKIGPEKSK